MDMKRYQSFFTLTFIMVFALSGCNLINPAAADQTTPVVPTTVVNVPTISPTATLQPTPEEKAAEATATTEIKAAQLTTEILRNMEYNLPVYQKNLRLKNGKYEEGSGPDFILASLSGVSGFGDLNGDDLNDAAVILAENGGGSGIFESLVAVLNQEGTPVQVGSVLLGDRVRVNSITIRERHIVLDILVQSPNDSLCCPTQQQIQTYALGAGGLLVLTHLTSSTPDGAVREIQIESPAAGTNVDATVQVKGRVAIAPFENTLAYRLYDAMNNKLDEGSFMVTAADMGAPGTFDVSIDLTKVSPGLVFRLEIVELSMADGTTLALDSLEMIKK